MILCDAGVLLCLIDPKQSKHRAYMNLIAEMRQPVMTTWACLAESMHLALGKGGWPMQKKLLSSLQNRLLIVHDIRSGDHARLLELMEKYQDRPMDLADATLVVAAETTGEKRILTLDSDFLFYRILGRDSFDVIAV